MADPMIIKVENQKINIITEENPIILKQTGQGMPGRDGATPEWGHITGDISDQTDLQNALDAKADSADLGALATKDTADFYDDISNKPAGYPPSPHNHDDRYYTEGETDTLLSGKSDTGHTHTVSDVTDFPTLGTLASKNTVDWDTDIDDIPLVFPPDSHTHTTSDITDFPTLGALATKDTVDWDTDIDDIPATFTPSSHSHTTSDITDFPTLGTMASVNDATSDNTMYVRKNGAWVALPVYNGGVS